MLLVSMMMEGVAGQENGSQLVGGYRIMWATDAVRANACCYQ